MAIVVPFIQAQVSSVIRTLKQWGSSDIKPCERNTKWDYTDYLTLVIYYDKSFDNEPGNFDSIL